MDAPLYPPTTAYGQPQLVKVPHAFTTSTASISEMLADPEARALVEATVPGLISRTQGQIAPYLDELSFRAIVSYGLAKSEELDRLDTELAKLNARRGLRG